MDGCPRDGGARRHCRHFPTSPRPLVNVAERTDLADLRGELMSELRELRNEIRALRSELDQLKGGIALIKWLGPTTLIGVLVALARAYGVI